MLVEPALDGGCDAATSHAATSHAVRDDAPRRAKILLFDSGLGGLTVLTAVAAARPDADLVYAADDAGFPYGDWREAALVSRIVGVVGALLRTHRPDLVVIACNTASTLVLPDLRAAFPDVPFVGTVPAIKPAAALSRSRMISVLATPGTVRRDYTHALIARFAGDCRVTLVGSTRLAMLAEQAMAGVDVADGALAAEVAPCFVAAEDARTDAVVLACTHYPLLRDRFERLAPWPVAFIDPAPAIARRVDGVLRERGLAPVAGRRPAGRGVALFTSGRRPAPALRGVLDRYGLAEGEALGESLAERNGLGA